MLINRVSFIFSSDLMAALLYKPRSVTFYHSLNLFNYSATPQVWGFQ